MLHPADLWALEFPTSVPVLLSGRACITVPNLDCGRRSTWVSFVHPILLEVCLSTLGVWHWVVGAGGTHRLGEQRQRGTGWLPIGYSRGALGSL